MDASAIIESNGKRFSVWNLHLAVSQTLQPDGSQPLSISLRCVPARTEGVTTETLESAAISLHRGSESEVVDPLEQAALNAMREALVTFLRAKGL